MILSRYFQEESMTADTKTLFPPPHFPPILTDVGNGASFTMLGTRMRLIATGANTGGRFTVGEQVTPVGWGPPRHIHSREDEIFYILEGTYEMHVGDERRTLSAGACAILPRNVPHGFRNVASTPSIKNYHVVAIRVRRGNLRTSFILR